MIIVVNIHGMGPSETAMKAGTTGQIHLAIIYRVKPSTWHWQPT